MPGCLVLVAAVVSFGNVHAAEAPPKPATAQASAPVAGKFRNEQHWIVDSVARDVSEMLLYAMRTPAAGKEGDPAVPAQAPGLTALGEVTVSIHPWAAETYAPLAKAVLEQRKIKVP